MTDFMIDLDAEFALQSLIEDVAQHATPPAPPTGVARKAATTLALQQGDLDILLDLQEKMEQVIDTILANKIDLDHLGLLTPGELYEFMVEFLDQRVVKELLEIRYKMLREAIFAHITEQHRAKGVLDPEHTPGEAAVPKLGKRFTREGGRAKAKLDEKKLAALLGEAEWAKLSKKVVVPAVAEHVEYVLDEDMLVAAVQKNPSMLEVFRECVIPGTPASPRFMVRELKADEHGTER